MKNRKSVKTIVSHRTIIVLLAALITLSATFVMVKALVAPEQAGLVGLGVGLAIGLAGLGAGIGMGTAGAAAVGAISERPEVFGKAMIFIVFIEAIGIYGLLIAFLLLGHMP
jgi:V/A-type H+-transporting ATPase subunit K